MSVIRREFMPSVDQYTTIPNAWLRDRNMTRRARGLLVELLSHREGWSVTVESLVRTGKEGKAAISRDLRELEELGYLRREQARTKTGFGSMDYVLTDPARAETSQADDAGRLQGTDKSVTGDSLSDNVVTDNVGATNVGATSVVPTNTPTKKNNQEDQLQEEPPRKNNARATRDASDRFSEFWAIYPRRQAKAAAVKAWNKAVKRADVEVILEAAARYRDDPQREPQFTAHPSTWLNQDRWEDEPLPAPSSPGYSGRGYDPGDWLGQDTRPTLEGEVVGQMEIGR